VVGRPWIILGLSIICLPTLCRAAEDIPDFVSSTGQKWKLLWHDEFDGEKLDESKWTFGLPWGGTDGAHRHHNDLYASYMMEHNVAVAGGKLGLLTRKEDVTARNGKLFHYTQAMVHTDGKFNHKYGYWEVRAKIPAEAGPGLWPAFWTLSKGWPPEMDILEVWTSVNRSHQGMAYRGSDGRTKWDDYNESVPLPTDWTTYGMEWGPGYQVYYLNGQIKRRVYGEYVTDVDHYVLLNSGVESGNLPTAGTIFPNAFEVDYVRVFERPDVPVVHNGGFEFSSTAPWTSYGRASVIGYGAHSGKQALRIDAAATPAGAEQRIWGLKPNTSYKLTGFAKVLVQNGQARIGVKGYGGNETFEAATQSEFAPLTVRFTTGPQATSATLYCFVPVPAASAIFDDLELARVAE
jgi:beta-glucanase (GH16 family)